MTKEFKYVSLLVLCKIKDLTSWELELPENGRTNKEFVFCKSLSFIKVTDKYIKSFHQKEKIFGIFTNWLNLNRLTLN